MSTYGFLDSSKAIPNEAKKLKEYGLKSTQFKITNEVLKLVISDYTKEAGVRQIERVIAKLMRKAIQKILKTNIPKNFLKKSILLK